MSTSFLPFSACFVLFHLLLEIRLPNLNTRLGIFPVHHIQGGVAGDTTVNTNTGDGSTGVNVGESVGSGVGVVML